MYVVLYRSFLLYTLNRHELLLTNNQAVISKSILFL